MSTVLKNRLLKLFLAIFVMAVATFSLFLYARAYADSPIVYVEDGAYVNVNTAGLKFQAHIEKAAYDELRANENYDSVSAGFIVVPVEAVSKAATFDFNGLSAVSELDGYTYFKEAEDFGSSKISGTYYYDYNITITDINAANYNRKFAVRAYIKIVSDTAVSGYKLYDGAYYQYSDYDAEENVRSVYEVSYSAVTDMKDESTGEYTNKIGNYYSLYTAAQYATVKSFADGVAVVENNAGVIEIANNGSKYYKSPYSVADDGDNHYIYSNPKGLIYNGNRKAALYATDGDDRISAMVGKGATVTEHGAIIDGVSVVEAPGRLYQTYNALKNNNYVAIAGNYGVGTYMDFYFTGNNMPSVMFFADKINGNMTGYSGLEGESSATTGIASGEKGVLITNGFEGQNSFAVDNGTRNYFMVYGPNRLRLSNNDSDNLYNTLLAKIASTSLAYKAYQAEDAGFNVFTHTGIKDLSTSFKYTVGTYEDNGKLVIDAALYNAVTGELISMIRQNTNLSTSSITAGNIIAYGAVKGTAKTTTFTYSKPYELNFLSNGASFAYDGTVTLSASTQVSSTVNPDAGGINHVYQRVGDTHRYIAFKGEYGVGTYMDFTFTGANIPQVMFFANNINGYILNYETKTGSGASSVAVPTDNKGVLFSNGIWTGTENHGNKTFRVWGPNRIKMPSDNIVGAYKDKSGYLATATNDSALSYNQLNTTYASTALKYVVGTYDANGYLGVEARLYNADTGAEIYSVNQVTTLATNAVTAGNIVVYGMPRASTTTFSYSEPYKSDFVSDGATLNYKTNTVTLAGSTIGGDGGQNRIYQRVGDTHRYIAFKGEYGVGTYMDFYFTGANMPQVMFFANNINGNILNYDEFTGENGSQVGTPTDNKGVLFSNGIWNSENLGTTRFRVWGPYRIKTTGDNVYVDYKWSAGGYLTDEGNGSAMCYDVLNSTYAETNLKYVVGTFDGGGYLGVDAKLYNADTEELIYSIHKITTLALSEITADNIVVYGMPRSSSTTFTYSMPYVSDANDEKMTFETGDASNYVAQNGGGAAISNEKAYQSARSLKLSSLSSVTAYNLYGFEPVERYNENDVLSVNMKVYLDAPAGGTLLITDADGEPYTYMEDAQTAIAAGAWTDVSVDIPVGYDTEKFLDLSFKLSGIADLSGVNIFVDNVSLVNHTLLGYSLIRTKQGLGGNTVYMLPSANAKQNMSFIVVNSDDEIIVIDGGYAEDADNIIDMLKELQPDADKPVVTAWLLTHGHCDHIGAISSVIESGEITVSAVYHDIPDNTAWQAAKTAGYDQGSDTLDETARTNLFNAIENYGITVIRPETGSSLTFGSAVFDILYTPTDNGTFTTNYGNNSSVIYKLVTDEKDVLFLGDAGTDQGNWLLNNKADELPADIVQMAHHGQSGVRQDCYQTIHPSVALWPTPEWVWTNQNGAGSLETLTVRSWMEVLGAVSYVSKDGIVQIF